MLRRFIYKTYIFYNLTAFYSRAEQSDSLNQKLKFLAFGSRKCRATRQDDIAIRFAENLTTYLCLALFAASRVVLV